MYDMLELWDPALKLIQRGINWIKKHFMGKVITVTGLALCLVLSSCDGPHQDQKSSPENPWTPNDTMRVSIPSWPSYFQAKPNFPR